MLSIIIVSFNSDKHLVDCLDSIVKFNDIGNKLQIIVVDNARCNSTKNLINRYENTLYLESSNTGFGSANNTGALHASNDYLLFLNPDTVLIEPIFEYSIMQFSHNNDLRAFGMILVDERGSYQETFGFYPENFKLVPEIFYLPLIKAGYTPPGIFPWGADLFVRKADFLSAGMFDENIFMCYEEPDLIHRLPKGKIKIFPKTIIHKAGHSNINLKHRLETALKSEQYYFDKHKFDYIKYIKIHKIKIKLALFAKNLFFIPADREIILLDLYDKILLSIASNTSTH